MCDKTATLGYVTSYYFCCVNKGQENVLAAVFHQRAEIRDKADEPWGGFEDGSYPIRKSGGIVYRRRMLYWTVPGVTMNTYQWTVTDVSRLRAKRGIQDFLI